MGNRQVAEKQAPDTRAPKGSLTCYACGNIKEVKEFRYECNCTDRKGVCKACEKTPNIRIPASHTLSKLHDFTPEYTAWCAIAFGDGAALGLSFKGDKCTKTWHEGPDGQAGKDFYAWIEQAATDDEKAERWRSSKREVEIPAPPKQICTCC
ncbi:MAG: hypothetical protein KGL39_10870 [Patescibacteria group bacterium]|nr:hypothetical protein [Patescibacteria group bacterium]